MLDTGRKVSWRKAAMAAILVAAPSMTVGCEESLPTFDNRDVVPISPRTVEVRLPFSVFGRELQTFSGFGAASWLSSAVVAYRYRDELTSRALVRFGEFPTSATVRDPGGTNRTDTLLTFLGGHVLVRIDTLLVDGEGPVTFAGGDLQAPWHPLSATWNLAVDTAGTVVPWPEEGAGPVRPLGGVEWNPEEGDSVVLDVDSATVAAWGDTTSLSRGLRLDLGTEGARLDLLSVTLVLDTKPSVYPDTVIQLSVGAEALTFVYDPPPGEPIQEIRLGGAPAWRTTFGVTIPEDLAPSPEFCAEYECPLRIDPEEVTFASLQLQPTVVPAHFQPRDTLFMEVRPVISPERLPKAPLGSPVWPFAELLPPEYFREGGSETVAIPLTNFVRDLVRGETVSGAPAPSTLALLSSFEPQAMEYASFEGPGGPGEPVLRLILTLADELPPP